MSSHRIRFGDKVRILFTNATEAAGVAGQTGIVHGETTPSVTGVEVIGNASEDYAIAVMIDGRDEALWFTKDLFEFVDHQAGTTIGIAGRRFVRDERGEWREVEPN
jgi:hypothetical protein